MTEPMTKDEINQAIAEGCGWRTVVNDWTGGDWWIPLDEDLHDIKRHPASGLPDYCGDLNAMHEAEKVLAQNQARTYRFFLSRNSGKRNFRHLTVEAALCHADALEKAEAFLRTLSKWRTE